MFDKDKNRYITKGIKQRINALIYLILWEMIDDMEVPKKDCLQSFDLRIKDETEGLMEIIHHQDENSYTNSIEFYTVNPVNAKIHVLDVGLYSTMFLEGEL